MTSDLLSIVLDRFHQLEEMGSRSLAQISEEDLHWSPDPESNSIAVIVQHLYGNALSRFTDFLTSDGEKPDRHRDREFEEQRLTLEATRTRWNEAWQCVYAALTPLTNDDLLRTVYIRKEPHSVLEALLRQLSHYAYHVGQLVYLAKHRAGSEWKTLSIARGRSEEFVPEGLKH